MSEFSIPELPRARVLKLVERIAPLVLHEGQLHHIAPCDPWTVAYSWSPVLRHVAVRLELISSHRTLCRFAAPSFFKPTIAEVLAQIPHGEDIVAFHVVHPGRIEPDAEAAYAAGFHTATTRIYRRLVAATEAT